MLHYFTIITTTKEELLVVVGVGVQTVTTYASGRRATVFHKASDIQDLLINEHVSMVSP